jgi:cell division protein FtsB
VTVAGGDKRRASARRRTQPRRATGPNVRWLRIALPLAVLGLVAFLYWQPLSSYMQTRDDLARRQREVAELRAEKALLEQRVDRSTSLVVLAQQARRTGLIRPGEQLFIVKGIASWRHARAASAK